MSGPLYDGLLAVLQRDLYVSGLRLTCDCQIENRFRTGTLDDHKSFSDIAGIPMRPDLYHTLLYLAAGGDSWQEPFSHLPIPWGHLEAKPQGPAVPSSNGTPALSEAPESQSEAPKKKVTPTLNDLLYLLKLKCATMKSWSFNFSWEALHCIALQSTGSLPYYHSPLADKFVTGAIYAQIKFFTFAKKIMKLSFRNNFKI